MEVFLTCRYPPSSLPPGRQPPATMSKLCASLQSSHRCQPRGGQGTRLQPSVVVCCLLTCLACAVVQKAPRGRKKRGRPPKDSEGSKKQKTAANGRKTKTGGGGSGGSNTTTQGNTADDSNLTHSKHAHMGMHHSTLMGGMCMHTTNCISRRHLSLRCPLQHLRLPSCWSLTMTMT